MKTSQTALTAALLAAGVAIAPGSSAFVPPSLSHRRTSTSFVSENVRDGIVTSGSSHLALEKPSDRYSAYGRGNASSSPGGVAARKTRLAAGFLGQDDVGGSDDVSTSSSDDDDDGEKKEYKQTMSDDERRENLSVMRQIFKHDLQDLQRRRDYAGWVEAKKDLKRRAASDPWFELNDQLKEAVQLDAPEEEILRLQKLVAQVGGAPPGVTSKRPYAVVSEIYDTGMSLGRAEAIAEMEQRKVNHAKWQAMIAEREANERKAEEERETVNPYLREEEEARKRREKTMRIIYGKVEEERKKKEERAREIQEKYGLDKDDLAVGGTGGAIGGATPLDRAIEAAKKQLEEKKKELGVGGGAIGGGEETAASSSSSTAGDDAKAADSKGGRPRMPGDVDMTRGEIDIAVEDSSDVTTNDVRVQVTSGYNPTQSDPPMRKHCFTYTIKITNLSDEDAIQLTSRKFEIQTVGARQKDVVAGQGVTGRQPVLRPGETFEYTSTAPLSVRPIGTTIAAARMSGEYEFNVVDVLDETEDDGQPKVNKKKEGVKCELGMFHFIFPEDQRVKPVTPSESSATDDDDDDDEDEDDSASSAKSPTAASAPAQTSTSSATTSSPSLPGDQDMKTGLLTITPSDSSECTTGGVRVGVTSEYKPERSDPAREKHVFSYSVRITNENDHAIKLTGRRFEIQTIGNANKDVVVGQGVTGRYPVLQPGESFEYTSTAPLSVKPLGGNAVVARMGGCYTFARVAGKEDEEKEAPPQGEQMEAKLESFHFMLPALDAASL